MPDIPTPTIDHLATEARLLRVISKMAETVTIANCLELGRFDANLAHCVPSLIRIALEDLREFFMAGKLDLMTLTASELEMAIALAVSTAAGTLIRTAPDGERALQQAPNREKPAES